MPPRIQYKPASQQQHPRKELFNGWVFGLKFKRPCQDLIEQLSQATIDSCIKKQQKVIQSNLHDINLITDSFDHILKALIQLPDYAAWKNNTIAIDISESINVKDIAKQHKISARSVQRQVQNTYGLSPKQLINLQRFQQSIGVLIDDNASLIDCSHELGYSDQAHFSRDFKKNTGISPSQFQHLWKTDKSNDVLFFQDSSQDSPLKFALLMK